MTLPLIFTTGRPWSLGPRSRSTNCAALPRPLSQARKSPLIVGFESPVGTELLATVDWLIEREHCEPNLPAIRDDLARRPAGPDAAQRKLRIFNDRLLDLALNRPAA